MFDAARTVWQSRETLAAHSDVFEQPVHGRENHFRAERESRVDGEEFYSEHFV